jgi:multiple sugar transport system permease protein
MVLGSLREAGLAPSRGVPLPSWPPAFSNYAEVLAAADLGRSAVNSLVVAVIAVPAALLVGSLAGYAIARLRGPAAAALVGLSLVAVLIPPTSLIVGRFTIFRLTSLTDTYWPLVAPALIGISPVLVLIYAWGYRRVPVELYETSRIEGLTELQTWWRVGVPLVRRPTVAAALFAFVLVWGDVIGPLIYLSDPSLFTLPLALRSLSGLDVSDQPLFLAAAVMATVPPLLVAVAAGRFVARGAEGRVGERAGVHRGELS